MIFLIPPVQILCLTHLGGGGGLTLAYYIWHMGVSPWDDVPVHSWSRYDLKLWPQHQIYRVFDIFWCPAHNYFLVWHWLTVFGTWVYHHKTTCHEHSWSRQDLKLWPQVQFILCLTCLLVWPITFFFIWHWLTIFGTWVYHYEKMWYVHSCSWFDFDLKVKFIGFCHVLMSDL